MGYGGAMNLTVLACPECKGNLTYDNDVMTLHCNKHGAFPLIEGIPSFVEDSRFDSHWNNHALVKIPIRKKGIAFRFLKPILNREKTNEHLLILDAGCGDGVHVEVLSEYKELNNNNETEFIGIDISIPAIFSAKIKGNNKWSFVHANIDKMPFKDSTFDVVYSFGVIAYTDDPEHSFSELCRVVRDNGIIGVWIYPHQSGIPGLLLKIVRAICRMSGPVATRLIANIIVPFLGFIPTCSGITLINASWKQCREVVLVNIAPKRLVFPTITEVEKWFEDNGIEIIYRDRTMPITLWGRRKLINNADC